MSTQDPGDKSCDIFDIDTTITVDISGLLAEHDNKFCAFMESTHQCRILDRCSNIKAIDEYLIQYIAAPGSEDKRVVGIAADLHLNNVTGSYLRTVHCDCTLVVAGNSHDVMCQGGNRGNHIPSGSVLVGVDQISRHIERGIGSAAEGAGTNLKDPGNVAIDAFEVRTT